MHERVEISRDLADGEYRTIHIARAGDRIAFAAFPDVEFSVSEIVPAP